MGIFVSVVQNKAFKFQQPTLTPKYPQYSHAEIECFEFLIQSTNNVNNHVLYLAGTITELEDHVTVAEASMFHLLNQ